MQDRHGSVHQIATLWHSAPKAEFIDTHHGFIRVLTGPAAYQLSSGKWVDL